MLNSFWYVVGILIVAELGAATPEAYAQTVEMDTRDQLSKEFPTFSDVNGWTGRSGAVVAAPNRPFVFVTGVDRPPRAVLMSNQHSEFNHAQPGGDVWPEKIVELPSMYFSPRINQTLIYESGFSSVFTSDSNKSGWIAGILDFDNGGDLIGSRRLVPKGSYNMGQSIAGLDGMSEAYAILVQEYLSNGDTFPRVVSFGAIDDWDYMYFYEKDGSNVGRSITRAPTSSDLIVAGSASGNPWLFAVGAGDGNPKWQLVDSTIRGQYEGIVTVEDGYWLIGWVANEVSQARDLLLVRTDTEFKVLFRRYCGGRSDDLGLSGIATSDGGLVVGGETQSKRGPISGSRDAEHDPWLIRLDRNGAVAWETSRFINGRSDMGGIVGFLPLSQNRFVSISDHGGLFDVAISVDSPEAYFSPKPNFTHANSWIVHSEPFGAGPGEPVLTCVDPAAISMQNVSILTGELTSMSAFRDLRLTSAN